MREDEDLRQWLEQRGWRLHRRASSGHTMWSHPDAVGLLTIASTSGRGRAISNAKAQARRLVR
jgi:hypothetical protein